MSSVISDISLQIRRQKRVISFLLTLETCTKGIEDIVVAPAHFNKFTFAFLHACRCRWRVVPWFFAWAQTIFLAISGLPTSKWPIVSVSVIEKCGCMFRHLNRLQHPNRKMTYFCRKDNGSVDDRLEKNWTYFTSECELIVNLDVAFFQLVDGRPQMKQTSSEPDVLVTFIPVRMLTCWLICFYRKHNKKMCTTTHTRTHTQKTGAMPNLASLLRRCARCHDEREKLKAEFIPFARCRPRLWHSFHFYSFFAQFVIIPMTDGTMTLFLSDHSEWNRWHQVRLL